MEKYKYNLADNISVLASCESDCLNNALDIFGKDLTLIMACSALSIAFVKSARGNYFGISWTKI